MTTLVIPPTVDPSGMSDVWAPLSAFIATAKPGDTVQAPPNATFLCDRSLELGMTGVKFQWEGATFRQATARPYGAQISDGTIFGTHLRTSTQLPPSVNWGYVTGPGIRPGTEIVLDADRKGGTLSNVCTDGTGLPITFTSKQDRARCGFDITGTDLELHNATWVGVDVDGVYVSNLEAQHGVGFRGATNVLLDGIHSRDMYGDGIYFGALGTRPTTNVTARLGSIRNHGRSGLTPPYCSDCSVSGYMIGDVARTILDLEPPDAGATTDRFALTASILGTHRLTLVSSGGDRHAHVGAVTVSGNSIIGNPMNMWLTGGDGQHRRGPYTIEANYSKDPNGYGTTWPAAALIVIENAIGATVQANTGIVLQSGRTPEMAFVRYGQSGPVVVNGNQLVGGIEAGGIA